MQEHVEFRVERVGPEHARALLELLGSNGFGCYCRYWHFGGDNRQWLDRCFNRAEENQTELLDGVGAASPEMRGMVAFDASGALIGWLKLAPVAVMTKLYSQRLYKGLPCFQDRDPAGVLTVGCL